MCVCVRVCPQSFEVENWAVLAPGSLGVENVHGQCGMVKDHTHTHTNTHTRIHNVSHRPWHLFLRWLSE